MSIRSGGNGNEKKIDRVESLTLTAYILISQVRKIISGMPIHQSDKREIIEEIVRLLYRGLHKNQMEDPDPGESMSKYISAPSNQIGIRVLTIVDN